MWLRRRKPEKVSDLRIHVREGEIQLRWKDLQGIYHSVWIPITLHQTEEYTPTKEK